MNTLKAYVDSTGLFRDNIAPGLRIYLKQLFEANEDLNCWLEYANRDQDLRRAALNHRGEP